AFALEPAVRALGDPRLAPSAMGAIGRLGDASLPALAALLESADPDLAPLAGRMVRSVTTPSVARDEVLRRHVQHRDRELGRLVMDRLAGPGPSPQATAEVLDGVLNDEIQHAARILGAIVAIAAGREGPDAREAPDEVLRIALDDELVLVRQRVVAGRMARY